MYLSSSVDLWSTVLGIKIKNKYSKEVKERLSFTFFKLIDQIDISKSNLLLELNKFCIIEEGVLKSIKKDFLLANKEIFINSLNTIWYEELSVVSNKKILLAICIYNTLKNVNELKKMNFHFLFKQKFYIKEISKVIENNEEHFIFKDKFVNDLFYCSNYFSNGSSLISKYWIKEIQTTN